MDALFVGLLGRFYWWGEGCNGWGCVFFSLSFNYFMFFMFFLIMNYHFTSVSELGGGVHWTGALKGNGNGNDKKVR